jgi:hypothetical protein
MRFHGVAVATLMLLAAGLAMAQVPPSGVRTQVSAYGLKTFGTFRALILQGDFAPKVNVRDVMTERPTTGVGAVADARGEISIYDGKLIISYGKPGSQPAESEQAALLAVATAPAWQLVTVDHDVLPEEIDAFLSRTAGAHGLDPEGPFPFQVRGVLRFYVMHVNAAPTNGPHGMGQPIAVTVESKGETLNGAVAGLYASRDLVGVVSHGGARTHAHWVASDASATAHLDRWGLQSGSVLSLPKP